MASMFTTLLVDRLAELVIILFLVIVGKLLGRLLPDTNTGPITDRNLSVDEPDSTTPSATSQ